jgi:transposase
VDNPDHVLIVPLEGTCTWGRCRSQIPMQILPERRKVVELVIRSEVTEYQTVSVLVPADACIAGSFPRTSAHHCNTGQVYRHSRST